MNVNKIMFAGRITRDPALKYLPSNTAVVEFGMVSNRKFRTQSGEDKEEATFIDVAAFGKTGEAINQYCRKGSTLFIDGRLKFDTWEDKQGGGKRSKLTVVVDTFQFVGGRDAGSGTDSSAPPQRPVSNSPMPRERIQNKPAPEDPFTDEKQFTDDDIPFAPARRSGAAAGR